jgi:hypothetical protein
MLTTKNTDMSVAHVGNLMAKTPPRKIPKNYSEQMIRHDISIHQQIDGVNKLIDELRNKRSKLYTELHSDSSVEELKFLLTKNDDKG